METNDIKETWKAGIERTIKPYPEERLNEMVVNSARKSIKTVYPGTVFRLVIIAVAVFLIVSQFVKEQNATRMYLDMGVSKRLRKASGSIPNMTGLYTHVPSFRQSASTCFT